MKSPHLALACFAFVGASLSFAGSALLVGQEPIALPGRAGRFDFLEADGPRFRILAAHKSSGSLTVWDVKTNQFLAEIPVGEIQGIAVDLQQHRYFAGVEGEHKVVVVDANTLKKTAKISVDGPVDAIAFDSKNKMIYADEDHGKRVWVIDSMTMKVVETIPIPGDPEVIAYSNSADRIYQNIKTKDLVARINPMTNKIDASWATAPATSPHGLAVDENLGRLYVAGGNGKLIAMDFNSGKVVSIADIATGVDQIAFDAERHLIYCACKGFISTVKTDKNGLQFLGNVVSPKGAHTLAVAMSTHDVWTAFSDDSHSYLQRLKPLP